MHRLPAILASLAYIAVIIAANWLTATYGLIPIGFGLMATAGTIAAGLALLLRDLVQDATGRLLVIALIITGAALSAWLANPALAIASGVAFLLSELADFAVYTPLRRRSWTKAVIASNTVAAPIDTVIFLWLAGFPLTWPVIAGQLVGKLVWATLLPVAATWGVRRVVSRQRQQPTGA
jgi:uncharacterized PurR-regulated membrane protein YhhQ (DUF165 family)